MARKSFNEKLYDSKDLPKIIDISDKPEYVTRMGGNKMLISPPLEYNEIMSNIPKGQISTTEHIRKYLAKKHGAHFTCPLTAGIFINICANASVERESNHIPYWRTLKQKGELNPKFPGGCESQKEILEEEGHSIISKGKKYFVDHYEDKLWEIN